MNAEVRLYDRLFTVEEPGKVENYRAELNPASLEVVAGAKVEPSAAGATVGTRFQFERIGYFCADRDSTPGKPVFNRTVTLKDSWAKIEKGQGLGAETWGWEGPSQPTVAAPAPAPASAPCLSPLPQPPAPGPYQMRVRSSGFR